jgi:hypothetical protein
VIVTARFWQMTAKNGTTIIAAIAIAEERLSFVGLSKFKKFNHVVP